ncbi:MAG: archaemetzincin family Zn-dependent metalloprotease [Terriglobia bacterium]
MPEIYLVRIGDVDADVLSWLQVALTDTLGMPCLLEKKILDPADAYHAGRQQYFSTQLLGMVLNSGGDQTTKLLGVCEVDLFIPVLTFVFGEAQWKNRAALISTCRLRQGFYGLPEDMEKLYGRCEKEAVHELGHTFGLVHCSDYSCVMSHSNSVDQIDLKSNRFCPTCLKSLR